jgi:hypothetical protein
MTSLNNKPILVTGAHRSGSTWVGHMLALSPALGYIHEPFNLGRAPGICKAKFDIWFQYICNQNESLYANDLEDCLRFKCHVLPEFRTLKSLEDLKELYKNFLRCGKFRVLEKRPLVKDPIAIFSAEWLVKRFNMNAVILIRHPAAFVGSLKKAGWVFDFNHFLQQPLLMERYFLKYKSEIEEYAVNKKDITDQAILLWNLIYHVVLIYQKEHPNWIFARHEDLSKSPGEGFSLLYSKLGLNFSTDIKQRIISYSSTEVTASKNELLRRDSGLNIFSWKTRLTHNEIGKVKENTFEVASKFYAEADWIESKNESPSDKSFC